MPRLSDLIEDGTIVGWLKAAGESVALGEELVDLADADRKRLRQIALETRALAERVRAGTVTAPSSRAPPSACRTSACSA